MASVFNVVNDINDLVTERLNVKYNSHGLLHARKVTASYSLPNINNACAYIHDDNTATLIFPRAWREANVKSSFEDMMYIILVHEVIHSAISENVKVTDMSHCNVCL